MAEITDPDVLKQFEVQPAAAPSGLVTDPEILKHFDTGESDKPSVAADVAKSIGSGAVSGPVIAAGTPGDLSNLLAKGSKVAGDYIAGKMGFGPSPEIAPPILPTSEGIKQSIGNENPVGQAINYDPQTNWGKLAKSGAETAANPFSYLGPGGVLAKGATAAASGVGSEAATEATENAKPWVKAVAPLVGAIAGGHVTSLPRVITPNVISNERQAMIDVLQHEGVPLTAGDRTGNLTMKAAESELSPGVNEAQRDAFHQAAFNRVGETIGDRPIQGANGAVDTMMRRVGQRFDDLASRNDVNSDPQLRAELADIYRTYNDVPGLYPQETVNSINGSLGRVQSAFQQGGTLSGPEYLTLRSNLRAAAMGATDPQRAEGLHGVTNALDDAMDRSINARSTRTITTTNPVTGTVNQTTIQVPNPDAGAFADARRDYRNALVLQRWAGSANMTPSTLAQSAKAVYGKNQYVRGMDDFSDLAESGRNVMKQFQDSGTARRLQIEGILKALGGVAGFGAGAAHGGTAGAAEGGVAGLLLGELAGPMIARPAARAALMNPVTQAALANQLAPYRFGTSPSTIALMNAIRGGQTPQIPAQNGQRQ